MKVIIAGTRDFNDYHAVKSTVARTCWDLTEVVSGGASGADALGEEYARHNGIPVKIFKADWSQHGKAAGPIRNREMATYADALIAFWDGVSKGTMNMIQEARNAGLKVYVYQYNTAERLENWLT